MDEASWDIFWLRDESLEDIAVGDDTSSGRYGTLAEREAG